MAKQRRGRDTTPVLVSIGPELSRKTKVTFLKLLEDKALQTKSLDLYCKIMMTLLPNSPKIVLFFMIPCPFKSSNDVFCHFLSSASVLIAHHWKSVTIPSLSKLSMALGFTRDPKHLLFQESDRTEQFRKTWASWSMFWLSPTFKDWISE